MISLSYCGFVSLLLLFPSFRTNLLGRSKGKGKKGESSERNSFCANTNQIKPIEFIITQSQVFFTLLYSTVMHTHSSN